jgi:hypothetical protein
MNASSATRQQRKKSPGEVRERKVMQPQTVGSVLRCLLCEKPVENQRFFTCRRCKKSPFCLEHLDQEYKVCTGCAAEERVRLYRDIVRQERSVKGFLRFTQFVFMLAAMFFAFDRLANEYVPVFLKESFFFEYVFYWGGAAVVGMALCYLIIFSQKQKIREVEDKIQSHKVDARYLFR